MLLIILVVSCSNMVNIKQSKLARGNGFKNIHRNDLKRVEFDMQFLSCEKNIRYCWTKLSYTSHAHLFQYMIPFCIFNWSGQYRYISRVAVFKNNVTKKPKGLQASTHYRIYVHRLRMALFSYAITHSTTLPSIPLLHVNLDSSSKCSVLFVITGTCFIFYLIWLE